MKKAPPSLRPKTALGPKKHRQPEKTVIPRSGKGAKSFKELLSKKGPVATRQDRLPSAKTSGAGLDVKPRRDDGDPGKSHQRDPFESRFRQAQVDQELVFNPLPPVLQIPVNMEVVNPTQAATVGSGVERAQAAAMAERLVSQFRIGRNGDSQEVRMQLSSTAFGDVEVRLAEVSGRLVAELHGASRSLPGLAARLEEEMEKSGVELSGVSVEWT